MHKRGSQQQYPGQVVGSAWTRALFHRGWRDRRRAVVNISAVGSHCTCEQRRVSSNPLILTLNGLILSSKTETTVAQNFLSETEATYLRGGECKGMPKLKYRLGGIVQ